MTASFNTAGIRGLSGTIRVPGDKSISHRSLIFSALGDRQVTIGGILDGADVKATASVLRALGVAISPLSATRPVTVDGVGLRGLAAPRSELDCGNSGTAMRLMAGILAAQRFDSVLVGDASLNRRPMRRIAEPLGLMGAHLATRGGCPPLTISPVSESLQGIEYRSPIASAQVKSCVLLAGLYASGQTVVVEPGPSRDHTERMLAASGVAIDVEGSRVSLQPGPLSPPDRWDVPGDFSSAFFWLVAASLIPGSKVTLTHVGLNPTRTGGLDILMRMGARVETGNRRIVGGEPVGDLIVRSAPLSGIQIGGDDVVRAIDEFPALFVAAAFAEGRTLVTGAEELRAKESDRIEVMASALRSMGAVIETRPDGAVITGGSRLARASVDSNGDHRCAMALAVAGAAASGASVHDVANVATSYPAFTSDAKALGWDLAELAA